MGLFVKLGIVEKFCALGAIAILTDYFLQLTLFLGVFVYDERRREAGRLDCLCCRGGSVASRPRNRTSESTSAILLKTCTRHGNVSRPLGAWEFSGIVGHRAESEHL